MTFEDIRELQERNRTLVQVVRRITAELRDHKTNRNDEMVPQDMNERVVEELKQQLEELKASRDRQSEMLETVKKAR